MNDFSNIDLALVLAFLVAIFVLYVYRKNLKRFNINFFKGFFQFDGETHVQTITSHEQSADLINENSTEALKLLKWIQENTNKVNGDYVLTETQNENAQIAARLYSKIDGEIIATCFFEDPDYGNGDFAKSIGKGVTFLRITTEHLCTKDTASILSDRIFEMSCKGKLVWVPKSTEITKIGGIFCKLKKDKSFLAFTALNNYSNKEIDKGLLFTGEIAEQFFEYYKSFEDFDISRENM